MTDITIALDAMGGDFGPSVVVPAAFEVAKKHGGITLILVGDQKVLQESAKMHSFSEHPRIAIQHASEVIAMDESPSQALRYKKDSSMRVAINLVKQGVAAACVSAGNTGALMATARFVLKTLPGVDRPAITTSLPTVDAAVSTRMLDLGANVDSSSEHLLQFAVMGSVVAQSVDNILNPKVALLNIGEEQIKGNEQVKQTADLLSDCSFLNYDGYIEADAIFSGSADVIVCDGFVGNVALKSSEGTAKLITRYMQQAFNKNLFSRCSKYLIAPVLGQFKKQIDPSRYNGASLVGLQGTVVKSHGSATVAAFANAIEIAVKQVAHDVPQLIRNKVEQILSVR